MLNEDQKRKIFWGEVVVIGLFGTGWERVTGEKVLHTNDPPQCRDTIKWFAPVKQCSRYNKN